MKTYGMIEATDDNTWKVHAKAHVLIRLKRLFPRVQFNRAGAIELGRTTEIARDLEWILDRYPMEMGAEDKILLQSEARAFVEAEDLAEKILDGNHRIETLDWEAKNAEGETPHADQLVAADLAIAQGALLIADDLGMGKSLTGLLCFRDSMKLPAVIVCQTHLPKQWLGELHDWTPLRGHIARVGSPYNMAEYNDGVTPDVLILPYSKLAGWAPALRGRVRAVVFDEVQELRRNTSQKYAAAGMIADSCDVVVGLTATPIYNYGDEVHNIFSIIRPDALGSREEFIREWGVSYGTHIGVSDPAGLRHWLEDQHLMVQRTWKDRGIDRPEPEHIPISIDSDEKIMDALTEEVVDMAELLVSRNASREELFKLSGDFDWKMRRATGIAKARFVAEFVKALCEQGEQVLLFGWHHDVYEVWRDRLSKYRPVMYTGKQTTPQKDRAKAEFMAGEAQVMVMSLRAGAGLDGLQERSHICVFGELDWSPGMHQQCLGRLNRGAQEKRVLGYFLVSDYGTDPMMADVLNLKRQQADGFMNPERELLAAMPDKDRIKRLAADFLERRGVD